MLPAAGESDPHPSLQVTGNNKRLQEMHELGVLERLVFGTADPAAAEAVIQGHGARVQWHAGGGTRPNFRLAGLTARQICRLCDQYDRCVQPRTGNPGAKQTCFVQSFCRTRVGHAMESLSWQLVKMVAARDIKQSCFRDTRNVCHDGDAEFRRLGPEAGTGLLRR